MTRGASQGSIENLISLIEVLACRLLLVAVNATDLSEFAFNYESRRKLGALLLVPPST